MTATHHTPDIAHQPEETALVAFPATQTGGADETEKKVKQLICEKLGLEEIQLIPGISFSDGLGVDSLDVFELIIEIENVFNINIPEDEAEKLRSPDALVTYVKKQKI